MTSSLPRVTRSSFGSHVTHNRRLTEMIDSGGLAGMAAGSAIGLALMVAAIYGIAMWLRLTDRWRD